MRFHNFGPIKLPVPVIGQGTWQIPDRGAQAKRSVQNLQLGIKLGLLHIDTAELYGDGRAEEVVGQAITGFKRDELFIVSKVLPQHASYRGTIQACDASLKRLGIDYLDVYLLHWQSRFPIEETMSALEELVDQGKTRALGVSNFDVEVLEEARRALQKHPMACNQVLYHLRDRGAEAHVSPYCAQHNIAIVGYSPFGQGDFPSPRSREGQVLAKVAERHNATPHQVAIAFLTRKPGTFVIPKSSDPAHLRENAAAGDLVLNRDDIAEIDVAFPLSKDAKLGTL